jgi:hypothetical protein
MKTNSKPSSTKSKKSFARKEPVGWQIRDLDELIKASGKSLYRIQKETGIPSGFLFHLKSDSKNRLNPSFATMTRIMKALGITDWEQLVERVPETKTK